ncbi:19671_t:CDS:1, partial [Racocetra persica]
IEEWEKLEYEDGSTRTIPLRSCVFCPSDAGLSSSRSDDFAFDSRVLIGIKRGMREALKGTWQSGQKEMQRMYLLENLNEIAAQLASASTDDLSKLKDEELTVILTSINGLKGEEGLSQGANDDFETIIKIIEEEIKRRGKEKEFLEKLKQEMEQDRTQREADRRRQRDLEQQIDRARAEGNQNLINELQGQLNETSDRINTADNQIRNGQEQATRLEAAINSSNERTRNYAQNMQSVLEDILQ